MNEYVCGFLFSPSLGRVCLIHKRRGPSSVIGRWNGVGGKIEKHEQPLQAMSREFQEETGVYLSPHPKNWTLCVVLVGGDWSVRFYAARSVVIDMVRTQEDEEVMVWSTDMLSRILTVPNLQWIIPMCLDNSVVFPVRVQDRVPQIDEPRP